MTTITKERLLTIKQWRETYGPGSNVVLPAEEAEELARIALAALDELEKMQAQSSKWCEAFHKAVSVGARYEERIAELERNEIREEGNQFLVVRHPGKLPVVKHCAGELEGFLRQLLEHDPMATIDIVTHRYYGVGGQWVQDADEYLQMMAAAAGKGE